MFDGVRPINSSQKVNSKGSAPTPILSEKGDSERKEKQYYACEEDLMTYE